MRQSGKTVNERTIKFSLLRIIQICILRNFFNEVNRVYRFTICKNNHLTEGTLKLMCLEAIT